MRLCALTHVDFEGPGHIGTWAEARGHDVDIRKLHVGDELPEPRELDGLMVMGGPMSVHDQTQHPWLRAEQGLIQRMAAAGLPVLGVCLGGQLIAAALGAEVEPSPQREIGFFPVRLTLHGRESDLLRGFPDSLIAFHWHGEAFGLPRHAVHLFTSSGCPVQGFSLGEHVLALQFHLEMTLPGIDALLANCPEDLAPGPYVQTAAAMREDAPGHVAELTPLADNLLDQLFT